jgi:hypothetical protein
MLSAMMIYKRKAPEERIDLTLAPFISLIESFPLINVGNADNNEYRVRRQPFFQSAGRTVGTVHLFARTRITVVETFRFLLVC